MEHHSNMTRPVLRSSDRSAWYAFGLWLRVVFVGMGLLATGVARLLEHSDALMQALAWLIGGGALAAFAWRRAQLALQRLDDAETRVERTALTDNLRASHHPANGTPETLFGLSAAATAIE